MQTLISPYLLQREPAPSYERLRHALRLRHVQLLGLLRITEAINDNVKQQPLFEMYGSFLTQEKMVGNLTLFIRKADQTWSCALTLGVAMPDATLHLEKMLAPYQEPQQLQLNDGSWLSNFDLIIPVWHKNHAVAYALVAEGELAEAADERNDMQQFIITLTNIVAVAIENKRLFKQQLEQERMNREMALAHDMQMMFVPNNLPQTKHYQLASIYKPHFSIGGDYFDFFELEENKIAFCIADISGKGVAAALLMSNFQANLHTLVARRDPMPVFIAALNEAVIRITKGDRFITFFWAEFDLTSRYLQYINAGHTPPVLAMNQTTYLLDKGCTILGSFPYLPHIETGELYVTAQEALILTYTDGLTDIADANGEYFNDDILRQFVLANADLSATAFNVSLMEQVDIFRGDQEYPDDFTVLTCKLASANGIL